MFASASAIEFRDGGGVVFANAPLLVTRDRDASVDAAVVVVGGMGGAAVLVEVSEASMIDTVSGTKLVWRLALLRRKYGEEWRDWCWRWRRRDVVAGAMAEQEMRERYGRWAPKGIEKTQTQAAFSIRKRSGLQANYKYAANFRNTDSTNYSTNMQLILGI